MNENTRTFLFTKVTGKVRKQAGKFRRVRNHGKTPAGSRKHGTGSDGLWEKNLEFHARICTGRDTDFTRLASISREGLVCTGSGR